MDTILLLAELEMANKAVSKWQATAELHRLELSTLKEELDNHKKSAALQLEAIEKWESEVVVLKAILEKKDEALRDALADTYRMNYLCLNVRTNADNLAVWNVETFRAESLRELIDSLGPPTRPRMVEN